MIDRSHKLSLSKQAAVVGISRGSVYYLPKPVSAADLGLMRRMDELHLELPFAGSRMLRDLLNAQGAAVNVTPPAKPESDQVSLVDVGADAVAERLRAVDPNTLSPLEALRLLFELKNDLG